jgi:Rrf2 family protein
MRISAKADDAVRAVIELAAVPEGSSLNAREIATAQDIPQNFLENILTELRRAGIVRTRRGAEGGYQLARPAREITVAAVLRAVEGPLAAVQGIQPQDLEYGGAAQHLPELWVAVRASLRSVLEKVTLADLAAGKLPRSVASKTADPDAWRPFRPR